jgi:hypothetical protein
MTRARRWFSRSNKATIAGYITAIFNALVAMDIDTLNWNLPSTYVKLFGIIVLPIVGGHMTEVKSAKNEVG